MKFVKCDKCGKTMPIDLVDSDYVVVDNNGKILDDRFDNPDYISEIEVAEKTLDICNACYLELKRMKERAEEDFISDLVIQKEGGNDKEENQCIKSF